MIQVFFIRLVRFLALVAFQVLLLNHIQLWGLGTPMVYVSFLLYMPLVSQRVPTLLWAFSIGLVVDVFSNTPVKRRNDIDGYDTAVHLVVAGTEGCAGQPRTHLPYAGQAEPCLIRHACLYGPSPCIFLHRVVLFLRHLGNHTGHGGELDGFRFHCIGIGKLQARRPLGWGTWRESMPIWNAMDVKTYM